MVDDQLFHGHAGDDEADTEKNDDAVYEGVAEKIDAAVAALQTLVGELNKE